MTSGGFKSDFSGVGVVEEDQKHRLMDHVPVWQSNTKMNFGHVKVKFAIMEE